MAKTPSFAEKIEQLAPTTEEYQAIDPAGYGATNTRIGYWTTEVLNTISEFGIISNDSDLGWSFTVTKECEVDVDFICSMGGATDQQGISLNSNELTTNIANINADHRRGYDIPASASQISQSTANLILGIGDVVRIHGSGAIFTNARLNLSAKRLR